LQRWDIYADLNPLTRTETDYNKSERERKFLCRKSGRENVNGALAANRGLFCDARDFPEQKKMKKLKKKR